MLYKKKENECYGHLWFEATVYGGGIILDCVKEAATLSRDPKFKLAAGTTWNIINSIEVIWPFRDIINSCI